VVEAGELERPAAAIGLPQLDRVAGNDLADVEQDATGTAATAAWSSDTRAGSTVASRR